MRCAQITYENDDQAAAGELASSLKEASGSPIYVPNFGQVQVTGVSKLDAPVVPAITRHVLARFWPPPCMDSLAIKFTSVGFHMPGDPALTTPVCE